MSSKLVLLITLLTIAGCQTTQFASEIGAAGSGAGHFSSEQARIHLVRPNYAAWNARTLILDGNTRVG